MSSAMLLPASAATRPLRTVCTITVNSPDERAALRAHLPPSRYRFVELVEQGRPNWLSAACRAQVRCDVLVVSAHFDGGNYFFADRPDAAAHLTVDELERVACSDSCPALFSRLREVYLFGCNTLDADPRSSATAEIVRTLLREGKTREEAERELRALTDVHGRSSRERMQQIFQGVPVIYGFSSAAPLGAVAGPILEQHLRSGGHRDVGSGRPSRRLLQAFAPLGMTVATGVRTRGPQATSRAEACRFADERQTTAQRLAFVHELLQRHIGEVRFHLESIQRLMASLDGSKRLEPGVTQALRRIADDRRAREDLLRYARQTDVAQTRVHLLRLAREFGWLDDADHRRELARLLREVSARNTVDSGEVALACTLNADGSLDGAVAPSDGTAPEAASAGPAAIRACLGSASDRARVLTGLLGVDEKDLRIAEAYLRQRPLAAGPELHRIIAVVADLQPGPMQVRALETLGRYSEADRVVLERLIGLYTLTPSAAVQTVIARILVRADRRDLETSSLVRTLIEHRRAAPDGTDRIIDILLELLESR